jgi:7,8-dihydropterin-6-yl-methyl-4-(beta-D-ribofuranosyl)aminobenzene 5'-phosphate synthase
MKIFTLIEDSRKEHSGLAVEHGLSLYFKQGGKRILFDTGASDLFVYNATLMGIDLSKVDICVISHAHNDHTGGLKHFLELNSKAKVYMRKEAAEDYYIKRAFKFRKAGIDPKVFERYSDRIVFLEQDTEIAEGVYAASIDKHRSYPGFASLMYKMQDSKLVRDDLAHELFLAVKGREGVVVLTGCAHKGVLNILMTAKEKFGDIKGVIGGFHLDGKERFGIMRKSVPDMELNAISKYINNNRIKNVYTGHCTGERGQERLELFARVKKLYAGKVIEI